MYCTSLNLLFSVYALSAQGYVCARRECMAPSVMNATQGFSTSAAVAVGPVSVPTTPTTAIHSLVSLLWTQFTNFQTGCSHCLSIFIKEILSKCVSTMLTVEKNNAVAVFSVADINFTLVEV